VSLFIAGELEQMVFKDPFQLKGFYGSLKVHATWEHSKMKKNEYVPTFQSYRVM